MASTAIDNTQISSSTSPEECENPREEWMMSDAGHAGEDAFSDCTAQQDYHNSDSFDPFRDVFS